MAPIAQRQLVQGAGPVGGEVVAAEHSPRAAQTSFDGGGDPAPIEAAGPLAGDEPQGPGESTGIEAVGLRFGACAGEASAGHEDRKRLFAEIRVRYPVQDSEPIGIGEGDAAFRRFDGGSQHLLPGEPPVLGLRLAEPCDRARHRGRERPGSGPGHPQ